ncbi:hypothetical protein KP754_03910, partial [Streptococcus equi subsp. equi]|nr:hypothetical protein [Streptococcus equi subsp. equi]
MAFFDKSHLLRQHNDHIDYFRSKKRPIIGQFPSTGTDNKPPFEGCAATFFKAAKATVYKNHFSNETVTVKLDLYSKISHKI